MDIEYTFNKETKSWSITEINNKTLRQLCKEISKHKRVNALILERKIADLIDEGPITDVGKIIKCKGCINHNAPTGVCVLGVCVNIEFCPPFYLPCKVEVIIQI